MPPRRRIRRRAALAVTALAVAACAGPPPPDPFAAGRLPATARAPVRLAALYAVPSADALVARVGAEPSGTLAALLEIAWEDAVDDAVTSSFVRAQRVASLSRVAPEVPGDVLVAVALEDARAGREGWWPARVELSWGVTSRAGGVLWSDSVAAEAPGDGARGLLAALRHAMVTGRRALLGQTLWRRYGAAADAAEAACE